MNAFHILLRKETIGTNLLRYINICIFQVPEVNPNAELILPPCPISQQESNWPLLAVSKGFFEGAIIKGNQPAATTGLTTNITSKLTANVHIDETATSGGDWADDEVQMELDDDDINKGNLNSNQDEQGEGWGDSEIELPPDLVSHLFLRK
jgi:coatomer protein complex subunit alpha (xenin)